MTKLVVYANTGDGRQLGIKGSMVYIVDPSFDEATMMHIDRNAPRAVEFLRKPSPTSYIRRLAESVGNDRGANYSNALAITSCICTGLMTVQQIGNSLLRLGRVSREEVKTALKLMASDVETDQDTGEHQLVWLVADTTIALAKESRNKE